MIVIEPIGGLGNQLFIYGVGLANSSRLGTELVADLSFIRNDRKREFEISSFHNSLANREPSPAPKMRWEYQVHRLNSKLRGDDGVFKNLHYELSPEFDSRFLDLPDGARIRGYFQSWRYLEPISRQLRKEVGSVVKQGDAYQLAQSRLNQLGNWTAVHFRRGDFDLLEGWTLGIEYYERALTLLRSSGKLQELVVFSDEIDKVKSLPLWKKFDPTLFFAGENLKPVENLLLMSSASNLVIANSSFSWWSAYVGHQPDRIVVFPFPWGNAGHNNRDLCLPDWIGIGRNA